MKKFLVSLLAIFAISFSAVIAQNATSPEVEEGGFEVRVAGSTTDNNIDYVRLIRQNNLIFEGVPEGYSFEKASIKFTKGDDSEAYDFVLKSTFDNSILLVLNQLSLDEGSSLIIDEILFKDKAGNLVKANNDILLTNKINQ